MTTSNPYTLRWGKELTNWPLIKLRMAAAQFNELGCDVDIWNLEHPIVGQAVLSDDRRVVDLRITEYPSPPVARWSAQFGIAISSLRSAADSFAWKLAHLDGREPPNPKQVYFPTREKQKDWQRQVQNLGVLPKDLVDRFADLRELDGGNWASWIVALAKLNNIDKHQSSLEISPDFSNASTDDLTIELPDGHGGTTAQFVALPDLCDARCGDVVARCFFSAPVLDAQGSLQGTVAPAVEFGPLQSVSNILHEGLMHDQVSHDLWRRAALQGRMCAMPAPYPQEFREDVVRVARNREPGQKLSVIAKDFGISESCLTNWMRQADVEDGNRPGKTREDSTELRELRRRNRLLEQENEVLRRAAAYLSQANLPGKSSTRS